MKSAKVLQRNSHPSTGLFSDKYRSKLEAIWYTVQLISIQYADFIPGFGSTILVFSILLYLIGPSSRITEENPDRGNVGRDRGNGETCNKITNRKGRRTGSM